MCEGRVSAKITRRRRSQRCSKEHQPQCCVIEQPCAAPADVISAHPRGSSDLVECSVPQAPRVPVRHVQFDLEACEVHEIIPYSDIYGMHPRDFVFDKGYAMIPALQHIAIDVLAAKAHARRAACSIEVDEEDEDHSDEDDSSTESED
eukprot:TRINITY_DN95826_c0_g1_i1.p1 TRINITY_DN95826_c0_g1~~TRINITY_DN95826_c0_g1_i1.p1  ORF type:complete len:148 (+),score=34.40 TRINITY_DN95826_c0_g1_i1:85-528(+)